MENVVKEKSLWSALFLIAWKDKKVRGKKEDLEEGKERKKTKAYLKNIFVFKLDSEFYI